MPDPRRVAGQVILDDLAVDFLGRDGVERRPMFGSVALAVHGKTFGFVIPEGHLVVKVPAERVEELAEIPGAERITMGRGVAREWIGVPQGDDDLWATVLEESYAFVLAGL